MKNSGRISKGNPNNGGNNMKSIGFEQVNHSRMKMKKNRTRMGSGGGGLSLQAFANAKTMTDGYNPALIKKQREFYKNAKCVNKYKKSLKRHNQEHGSSSATKLTEDGNGNMQVWERKNGNKAAYSLKEIYEKKWEEEEKPRMEKEAIIKAKKEEKNKSEARRRSLRERMFKRTKSGQPVMKYRIEHLLQTIQASKN